MKFFAAALALTLFLVGPAHAQFSLPDVMPKLAPGVVFCNKGETVCLVNRDDFEIVVNLAMETEAAQALSKRLGEDLQGKNDYIQRLEARLRVCHPPATLRVLPPDRRS